MGMLFGGWMEEEEDEWKASGLTWEKFQEKQEFERNNHVYPPSPKKARYRGIELCVGDRITPDVHGPHYIIRDFRDKDATPIVDLVECNNHDEVNISWKFDTLFKIVSVFDNQ